MLPGVQVSGARIYSSSLTTDWFPRRPRRDTISVELFSPPSRGKSWDATVPLSCLLHQCARPTKPTAIVRAYGIASRFPTHCIPKVRRRLSNATVLFALRMVRANSSLYMCALLIVMITLLGYLLVYPKREDVVFHYDSESRLRDYYFGKKYKPHRFCSQCGSSVLIDFKDSDVERQRPLLAVNVCIDCRIERVASALDANRPAGSTFPRHRLRNRQLH